MKLTKGKYTRDKSGLIMEVIKVQYVGKDYVKFKGTLRPKYGGWTYETKNYKVSFDKLKYWRKLDSIKEDA